MLNYIVYSFHFVVRCCFVTNLKRAKQIHDVTMRGADKDKVYITYVDLRIVKILLFIILTLLCLRST